MANYTRNRGPLDAYPGEDMNQAQIAAVYDSMTPEQQDMPREQFIKQAMDTLDLKSNTKILDHMVQRKRRATQGRMEQARIDAVLRERG